MGNVANNGYIMAKILNDNGIEAHSFVPDYYHVNGCPEWEDADFVNNIDNIFNPDWHRQKYLKRYKRPKWFAQGPRYTALRYLVHYAEKNRIRAAYYWFIMAIIRIMTSDRRVSKLFLPVWNSRYVTMIRNTCINNPGKKVLEKTFTEIQMIYPSDRMRRVFAKTPRNVKKPDSFEALSKISKFKLDKDDDDVEISAFQADPIMQLGYFDIGQSFYQRLFNAYDLVVGFAIDGAHPLAYGKPYIAFEHGTIRNLPFESSFNGYLAKSVYTEADRVYISNCDNIEAAEKMEIENYDFCPHPITERLDSSSEKADKIRKTFCERRDADFLILHPSRQHWHIAGNNTDWDKRNHVLYMAFAWFLRQVNPKALLICVDVGQHVQKSKAFIASLGITDRVVWISAKPHIEFMRYIQAADVIADQFGAPGIGGIPPKAMMVGKPVITKSDDKIYEWCFDMMPPILKADTEEDVLEQLTRLYTDKEFANQVSKECVKWYQQEYSNQRILDLLDDTVKKVLGPERSLYDGQNLKKKAKNRG